MKLVLFSCTIFTLFIGVVSCKKESNKSDYSSFDDIPFDKYYSTEILNSSHTSKYGSWIVYSTSGGFSGQGYTSDFDKLLLKPNGIFGIIRNDSLITYGKIVIKNQTGQELFVDFVSEDGNTEFEILNDNEKYLSLRSNDSLDLVAPCCDRFSTHLKRQ